MFISLSTSLCTNVVIFFLALLPVFLYKTPKHTKTLPGLIIVYLINELLQSIGSQLQLWLFPTLHMNWSGKLLSLLFLLIYILIFRHRQLADLKIVPPRLQPSQLKTVLLLIGGLLLIKVVPNLFTEGSEYNSLENYLYQATLPGIVEELAFRGVYLFLILQFCPSDPTRPFSFTPDMLFISLLFSLSHSLSFPDLSAVHFNPLYFASTFISACFYMALLRSSRSLIIPMVVHNLVNVGILIAASL
ncbi:MAG TPA: CPBP family glutamic-type intramembrane protease [Chitinophaga sp.]|uniref:CPBP family glutamic-type intramembrane protease n=1 Tax=Chitinophaga sp. TaxID=1869181 RepID=UPI002C9EEA40|nr:CPBP family glutamic-type intramembrane protease [Chitinophaga sp.]HVI43975.1 CPBP family glutamic-type intramembrane protease [Chitinophaga sp.]